MLISLKYTNPLLQSQLYNKFSEGFLNKISIDIKEEKKMNINNKLKSFEHKIVENILEELGVSFKTEYFNEYFIDIAVLNKQIAFEICGPGHYN